MGPPCGDRCPGGKHRPRRRGDTGPALLSGKVSPCNDGVPPPAPSSPLPTTAPHSAVHPAEQGRPPPKDGFPASRGRDSGENPAEMSDRRPGGRGAGPHSARQTPLHTAAWDKRLWGGGDADTEMSDRQMPRRDALHCQTCSEQRSPFKRVKHRKIESPAETGRELNGLSRPPAAARGRGHSGRALPPGGSPAPTHSPADCTVLPTAACGAERLSASRSVVH